MNLQGKTIAVTGATGFLGRYIVDSLLKRNAKVVGVVRNPDRVPALKSKGVELRKADLVDKSALVAGFSNCDAIVSNAALFAIANMDWQAHVRTNLQGSENVFDAASQAGVKRIIHVSSVAVYRKHQQPLSDEGQPLLSEQNLRKYNAYPVSKALSEQLAWKKAKEYQLDLTCARPCAIYGAHDPNMMAYLRRFLGWPIAPIPVLGKIGFVYAGDVAEGIAKMLENDISIGKAYNLTGPALSIWEFYKAWRQSGDPKAPKLPIPIPLPVRRLWDNSLAERDLGWSNRPFLECLQETMRLESESAA